MKVSNEFKTGSFIVITLLMFIVSIYILGKEREIFASQTEYFSVFNDVKGLAEGAPVRLGGITVGRVSEINFSEQLTDSAVHVTLLINDEYIDRIRIDSHVTIETQGLLGDRFISMSSGKGEKKPRGSTVPSKDSGDISQLLEKAGQVVENTVSVSDHISEVVEQFKKEGYKDLADSLKSISKISKEIEGGKGTLHQLIFSEKTGDQIVDGLATASKNLAELTEQARKGEGLVHALLYDPQGKKTVESLTIAAEEVSKAVTHISEIGAEIKSGEGVLNKLIYEKSPQGLDDTLVKLNATAENLRLASEALAKGSGTIGALLVDSKLYDNLVEVTDGAKRSFVLRTAIKQSLKSEQKTD